MATLNGALILNPQPAIQNLTNKLIEELCQCDYTTQLFNAGILKIDSLGLKKLQAQERYNLRNWKVQYIQTTSKRTLGVCMVRQKVIKMNYPWVKLNIAHVPDAVEHVLRHEFAHALDFEVRGVTGHDKHWRKIAHLLKCPVKSRFFPTDEYTNAIFQ